MRGIMKGTVFEVEAEMELSLIPNIELVSNLWIHSKNLNRPTEIDRLVVAPWGIYCLELKSFLHGITGELSDKNWTGFTGRKPTEIYNPVMQNFEHIRSLKWQIYRLGKVFIPVHNLVVVPDTCHIQTSCNLVIPMRKLITKLKSDGVTEPSLPFSLTELNRILERVRVKK